MDNSFYGMTAESELIGETLANALRQLCENGDTDAADHLARQQIDRSDNSWSLHFGYADLLWKSGDIQSAIGVFRRWLANHPDHANGWHWYANALSQAGAPGKEIQECYEHAVALEPVNPHWRVGLGSSLVDTGNIQRGVEEYRAAITIDPQYLTARYDIALAYIKLGDLCSAEAEIRSLAGVVREVAVPDPVSDEMLTELQSELREAKRRIDEPGLDSGIQGPG